MKIRTCLALLLSCNLAWAAPQIPQDLKARSLVYCTSGAGFSFNPQKADAGTNMNVVTEQIYDKLIEFDPHSNTLKPALAERFAVSEDGLSFTFFLRKNIQFQHTDWFTPTRLFNADDVLFSLNRMMENRLSVVPAPDMTLFTYFESIDLKNKLVRITAPAPDVVKIELAKPDASLLAYLASQYAVILSQEYAAQLEAKGNLVQLDLLPVGTGVYQLQSYVPNDYVRLKPNPYYWGKSAHIENMIVDFSTTGTGRMTKFLNGECDISAFPEWSQLSALAPSQGYISENIGANLAFLAFNFQRPIMQNRAIRQAVASAVDRARLARLLYYNTAEVAEKVVPMALLPARNPQAYPYRPQKLAEPQTLTLWVVDEKRVYNLHPLKMAELIRKDLAEIGITLNVRQVSRGYLMQNLQNQQADYDLILTGWLAQDFDPDSFLSPILSCQSQQAVTNLANWCNDEFDHLLQTARLSEDNYTRELLYEAAQRLLERELPILPLVNVNRLLMVNNRVQGVKISPFGQVKLSEIKLH